MMRQTAPARVRITIDRLVLDGFDRGQRKAIADALVAELQRQAAEPGFIESLHSFASPSTTGGSLGSAPDSAPASLGVLAATRILTGLRG